MNCHLVANHEMYQGTYLIGSNVTMASSPWISLTFAKIPMHTVMIVQYYYIDKCLQNALHPLD